MPDRITYLTAVYHFSTQANRRALAVSASAFSFIVIANHSPSVRANSTIPKFPIMNTLLMSPHL